MLFCFTGLFLHRLLQVRPWYPRPHACSRVVRIDPLRFLAGCRKRQLNHALSVCLLALVLVCVLLHCLLRPLFVYHLCFCVFCLLVVLFKLSVLATWLARKTPLGKPNRGEGIVCTKPRPKTVYLFFQFNILFHCFMMCLSCPQHYMIYFILLWHDIACLCWKCR